MTVHRPPRLSLPLAKPVVLVGLMGSGKSTVGSRLADRLGIGFIDTDKEIEKVMNCSISDIFHYAGEEYFREAECKMMKNLLETSPIAVIATGGGTLMDETTLCLVKERAISIWIKASLEVLVERVSRRNTRPVLEKGGDKREIMAALMDERYPAYSQADIIVESDNQSHAAVVRHIVYHLKRLVGVEA